MFLGVPEQRPQPLLALAHPLVDNFRPVDQVEASADLFAQNTSKVRLAGARRTAKEDALDRVNADSLKTLHRIKSDARQFKRSLDQRARTPKVGQRDLIRVFNEAHGIELVLGAAETVDGLATQNRPWSTIHIDGKCLPFDERGCLALSECLEPAVDFKHGGRSILADQTHGCNVSPANQPVFFGEQPDRVVIVDLVGNVEDLASLNIGHQRLAKPARGTIATVEPDPAGFLVNSPHSQNRAVAEVYLVARVAHVRQSICEFRQLRVATRPRDASRGRVSPIRRCLDRWQLWVTGGAPSRRTGPSHRDRRRGAVATIASRVSRAPRDQTGRATVPRRGKPTWCGPVLGRDREADR